MSGLVLTFKGKLTETAEVWGGSAITIEYESGGQKVCWALDRDRVISPAFLLSAQPGSDITLKMANYTIPVSLEIAGTEVMRPR